MIVKTFEDFMEDDNYELCNYCSTTGYGDRRSYVDPNGYHFCEGAYCKEAYESYLDEIGVSENVIKYMKCLKLIKKGD